MLMNKVKIRPGVFRFQLIFNIFYFLLTLINQSTHEKPIYFNNLNWFGDKSFSYLYNKKTNDIPDKVMNTTCSEW